MKPCPKCQSEVKIVTRSGGGYGCEDHSIECSCGIKTKTFSSSPAINELTYEQAQKALITWWNERAERVCECGKWWRYTWNVILSDGSTYSIFEEWQKREAIDCFEYCKAFVKNNRSVKLEKRKTKNGNYCRECGGKVVV